jgi:hypothetical protein
MFLLWEGPTAGLPIGIGRSITSNEKNENKNMSYVSAPLPLNVYLCREHSLAYSEQSPSSVS